MRADIQNYWVESSYDFEDKDKKYDETLVVAVTYKDRSTETIAHFNDVSDRASLETLVKHFNQFNL